MKKRNKKEETILIDLKARSNIRIIHSSKKEVSIKEMEEFENRAMNRYNDYCEFTELCIKKNLERNHSQISKQAFKDAMESMLEQNKLLENMIGIKEQEG